MSFIISRFPSLHPIKHRNVTVVNALLRNISSFVPTVYDSEKDPAPIFFKSQTQDLLQLLTRPEIDKIYRKRTNKGEDRLRTPQYKFLTNEQLQKEIRKAQKRADKLVQMPPIVKIRKPIDEVVSNDPALLNHDTCKYVFIDITFGIDNEHRLIVERDVDGSLRFSDHDTRKRMNQAYFPIVGRKIREPEMFSDDKLLNDLLEREEYEFILDRACIQYEPDEFKYQTINSLTYQHIDNRKNYQMLKSTRHFGPMVFYLVWNRSMDGLLLNLLQYNMIRDVVCLLAVRQEIHNDITTGEQYLELATQIVEKEPLYEKKSKDEFLTEDDIKLDTKCMVLTEQYITNYSTMKSQHELALQGFRENYKNSIELSRGLKKAHGKN